MPRLNTLVPLAMLASVAMVGTDAAHAQRPVVQSLDTVQVISRGSGSAAGRTRSVDVVSRADIQRRAGRSLAELLAFAIGTDVQTRSPAQSDLSLRGSTFNQVVILVDGVRVSDVQSGHYALDLAVPTSMIERIEILRGSGSALYGSDAIGGVVNIVTRDDPRAAALALRGGSYGGASGSLLASGDGGQYSGRVGADVDRSDGHRSGTDFRIVQVRASGTRALAGGKLVADVGQGVRRFGAANFYAPFNSDETTRSTTAAVRLVPAAGGATQIAAALHTRRHHDLFTLKREDPAFYQNEHTSWESGGNATLRTALRKNVVGVIGAEVLDARLRSARLGDHQQWRDAAFGQLTIGRASGATADVGVRGDWNSENGAFISPSLAVAVPLLTRAQLRASASRGFRAPTWTERFYRDPSNIADSSLAVERFWSGEVGVRAAPVSWLSADVAYFERHATDLIDWAKPAGAAASVPWQTRNFASARYRGVEGTFAMPALAGVDWTVRASGLRFDASTASGVVGKYALRPITRTLGVSAARDLLGRGSLTVDALRARRTGESDYVQVNARLVAPVRDLRLSLELVNLTNAAYLDGSGKPVGSRAVFAGVSWSGS